MGFLQDNLFARTAWEFYKEHPWLMASNLAFMALMPVNDVLLPHLFGELVDAVEHRKPPWRILAYVAAVLLFTQSAGLARDWLDSRTTPALEAHLRERLLHEVVKRYDGNLEEPASGEMVSRFVRVPVIVSTWAMRLNDYLIPFGMVLIAAVVYLLLNDTVLAGALVTLIVVLGVLASRAPKQCHATTVQNERDYNRMQDDIEEVLRNLQSVYAGDQVGAELRRLGTISEGYQSTFSRTMRCALQFKFIGVPMVVAFFSGFVLRCIWLIRKGRMSTGRFVSLFMVVSFMISSLTWCVSILRDVVFDSGTLQDMELQMMVKAPPYPSPAAASLLPVLPSSKPPPPSSDGIGLRNVTYTHTAGRLPTIDNRSMHFEEGERSVLLGPIGSGKSTVLRLLMCFYKPSGGDMYLGGEWYADLGARDVRRRVAYVPQEAVLFNRSVVDNVAYGNPGVTAAHVEAALERTGIAREFVNLKHGVHSLVGKGGSRLSGGQRQLVWFMRAVMRDPEVLLLDEPTASMDEPSKRLLIKVLETELEGRTVVMVTHDPVMVQAATRRVYI